MNTLSFKHLLTADQIQNSDLDLLFNRADHYRNKKFEANNICSNINNKCSHKILATLFFEPSTRTRFSFEAAMLKIGGQTIKLENNATSSVAKGESLSDMGRIISIYADIIVMRHPASGSVKDFSTYSCVPVINAGDGANQHPTQSLVDLYTIFCEKKRLNNLTIGILGDIKYSRTAYSLLNILGRYSNNKAYLVSHPDLTIEQTKKNTLINSDLKIEETTSLPAILPHIDILYVTRIQQERFADQQQYEKVKNTYHIDKKILKACKKDMIVMHPLPRINEISTEVDSLPCAKYFTQAEYGLYVRTALLSLMV